LTLSGDFAEKIWVPDTFFANDKNRWSTGVPFVLLSFKLHQGLLQVTVKNLLFDIYDIQVV
jgi:hypothetical protein